MGAIRPDCYGARVSNPADFCAACGAPNAGTRFCENCGAEFRTAAAPVVMPATATPVAATPRPDVTMSNSSLPSHDEPSRSEPSRGSFREGLEKVDNIAGRVATIVVGVIYIVLGIVAFAFAGAAPVTILIGIALLAYGVYLVSPVPRTKLVIY